AARAADEEAFLAREPARHRERFLVGDRHVVVDHAEVEGARHLVLADALDLVRNAFGFARALAAPRFGQNGADGIAGDDLDARILLLQIAADAADRAAGAGGEDEVRDASVG